MKLTYNELIINKLLITKKKIKLTGKQFAHDKDLNFRNFVKKAWDSDWSCFNKVSWQRWALPWHLICWNFIHQMTLCLFYFKGPTFLNNVKDSDICYFKSWWKGKNCVYRSIPDRIWLHKNIPNTKKSTLELLACITLRSNQN